MSNIVKFAGFDVGQDWWRTWGRIWGERLKDTYDLAGGTLAASVNGEITLGKACLCDNAAIASRTLPAAYTECAREWRYVVDQRLAEAVPAHLANRPGEVMGELFTREELQQIRMVEPVATFDEFEAVARNYQRYLKDWQQRNPSPDHESGPDNVIAYMKAEQVKPSTAGYLAYLRCRGFFFNGALNDSEAAPGFPARVPLKALREHAFVVAGTGGGKTELLKVLAAEIAATDAGILVVDPHGQLAKDIAHFEEFAGPWRDRLVYLDAADPDVRPCLNPFDGLMESAVRDEAGELASALQELLEERGTAASGSTLNMRLMVKNCIRVLLRTGAPDLRELYRFMSDADNGDLIELGKRSDNEMLASYFAADFTAKERGTTKTAVRARLQEILDGDRVHLFCGPATVDVEKCLSAGKVVVLNLGGVDAGTAEAIGRFMMARLFSFAKRRGADQSEKRRPVFVIADEAHLYLSRSAGEILGQTRKFGVHLIAAQQSVEQGHDPDVRKLLMGQTAVKFVGVTSQDAGTRRAFANVLDLDSTTLKNMRRLQFAYAVDGQEPAIIRPRSDRVHERKMSASEWERILKEQRARYYRPPGQWRRTAPATAQKHTEEQPRRPLFPDE